MTYIAPPFSEIAYDPICGTAKLQQAARADNKDPPGAAAPIVQGVRYLLSYRDIEELFRGAWR
jgi:hypothetical protein